MIITAWNCPGPEDYPLLKDAGINTVWGGEPEACEEHGLDCLVPAKIVRDDYNVFRWGERVPIGQTYTLCIDSAPYGFSQASAIGYQLDKGDDIPINELARLEKLICSVCPHHPEAIFPVLVSATYTRLLEHLGVESIVEYYLKFRELAPSALPVLCHYPFHTMAEDEHPDSYNRAEFQRNLIAMHQIFGTDWWAWIQITAIDHYGGEWQFREVAAEEIEWQVEQLMIRGCSGISYFTADGIIGVDGNPTRHFETIKAINESLAGK